MGALVQWIVVEAAAIKKFKKDPTHRASTVTQLNFMRTTGSLHANGQTRNVRVRSGNDKQRRPLSRVNIAVYDLRYRKNPRRNVLHKLTSASQNDSKLNLKQFHLVYVHKSHFLS